MKQIFLCVKFFGALTIFMDILKLADKDAICLN